MNSYETVIILSSEISKDERINAIKKIKNYIEQNGKITKVEDIGLRKFAYEIRKQKEGYYYSIFFEAPAESIYELERIYRITDEILKFIVVKLDN